jgi:Domain of Unknown Function (DUF928)
MNILHLRQTLRLTHCWSFAALTLGMISLEANLAQAVTFKPSPQQSTPKQSTGGASRGNRLVFQGGGAPKTSTGGASRGNQFVSQNGGAPTTATGGASRGTLFKPTPGGMIRQSTGGASRGTLFKSTNGSRILRATGGASRSKFFSSGSAPKQAGGGASRDATTYVNPVAETQYPAALIALVPQEFYGTTLSERPSILVYLPESNAEEAIFSLKDEAGHLVYQTVLPISGEAGIARIQLPDSLPALEVGKNYQWFTALKVDGRLSPSTPYVDGWIQRIAPTAEMARALKNTDAIARAEALAGAGIWYDSATVLAKLREQNPDHEPSLKNWQELLTSVGLQSIQTAPMLQYQ